VFFSQKNQHQPTQTSTSTNQRIDTNNFTKTKARSTAQPNIVSTTPCRRCHQSNVGQTDSGARLPAFRFASPRVPPARHVRGVCRERKDDLEFWLLMHVPRLI